MAKQNWKELEKKWDKREKFEKIIGYCSIFFAVIILLFFTLKIFFPKLLENILSYVSVPIIFGLFILFLMVYMINIVIEFNHGFVSIGNGDCPSIKIEYNRENPAPFYIAFIIWISFVGILLLAFIGFAWIYFHQHVNTFLH